MVEAKLVHPIRFSKYTLPVGTPVTVDPSTVGRINTLQAFFDDPRDGTRDSFEIMEGEWVAVVTR